MTGIGQAKAPPMTLEVRNRHRDPVGSASKIMVEDILAKCPAVQAVHLKKVC